MNKTRVLKKKRYIALLTVLITVLAASVVVYAWYVYNTEKHTTNVHMAAGAGASLQIANTYEGTYGQAAVLDEFIGRLNPVSTDIISNGFQKVYGFTNGKENQSNLVANLFGSVEDTDYYKTTLFLRTNGSQTDIYLSDIAFEDSDKDSPISTAIRIGIVTHKLGRNKPEDKQYIFAINNEDNPEGEYNTVTGEEGYVLDSTKTDGSTVPLTPYTPDNYCEYDNKSGVVTLKENSIPLATIHNSTDGDYGVSIQIDIYIWLEGCDKDCTGNLNLTTLRNLALSFAGLSNQN